MFISFGVYEKEETVIKCRPVNAIKFCPIKLLHNFNTDIVHTIQCIESVDNHAFVHRNEVFDVDEGILSAMDFKCL